MLLHDSKNEDGIKSFFTECHELYVKILMNPFYQTNDQINSNLFDGKLKAIARKHLT